MKCAIMSLVILTGAATISCLSTPEKNQVSSKDALPVLLPDAPQEVVEGIRTEFANALPAHSFSDSILGYLSTKYGITAGQILIGASTCVDDIIYTKNFHAHPEIKGPFHLGGLAGLPFTGTSGLSAFAHHIPENGTMLLIIAPHIGYSKERGWGHVLRHGQHEASSCCGALMGTLQKLQQGDLKQTEPTPDDYQGIMINNMASQHEKEIRDSKNPLAALTKLTYAEAEKQILRQVKLVNTQHVRYIVVMAGIVINTDYAYTDYLWLNHFSIYDVKNAVFLESK